MGLNTSLIGVIIPNSSRLITGLGVAQIPDDCFPEKVDLRQA